MAMMGVDTSNLLLLLFNYWYLYIKIGLQTQTTRHICCYSCKLGLCTGRTVAHDGIRSILRTRRWVNRFVIINVDSSICPVFVQLSSHQLFHILCVVAMLLEYHGLSLVTEDRLRFGGCVPHPQTDYVIDHRPDDVSDICVLS